MLTLDQKSSRCSRIFSGLYFEYNIASSVNMPMWALSKPGNKKQIHVSFCLRFNIQGSKFKNFIHLLKIASDYFFSLAKCVDQFAYLLMYVELLIRKKWTNSISISGL